MIGKADITGGELIQVIDTEVVWCVLYDDPRVFLWYVQVRFLSKHPLTRIDLSEHLFLF